MKRSLILSFILLIIMVTAMRYQAITLITEVTPKGIIDVEFAKTLERFNLFISALAKKDLLFHLILDFLFIGAYVYFFFQATTYIFLKNNWLRIGKLFITIGFIPGILDVIENILLFISIHSAPGELIIQSIFYIASLKFFLAGIVVLYLVCSLPFLRKKAPAKS